MGLWLYRTIFAILLIGATFSLKPFDLSSELALIVGIFLAIAIILFEVRARHHSSRVLIGATLGSLAGILAASLVSIVIGNITVFSSRTESFLQLLALIALVFIGMSVGATKGDLLNLSLGRLKRKQNSKLVKILDTSVIIDGRVADILDTGFLEGQLLLPQFVIHELQMVADSSDSIKRNRGRRGLDILDNIQKLSNVTVKIVDQDYPEIAEVDMKLIELAKETGAKIITNDFNLNKVARLHSVDVLNINELALVLKPVVLPDESMSVFILKEGKEYNQGIAYLDDGTMVVVDNARGVIGKTVDITVTSVLQTTAGKMIFSKYQASGGVQQRAEYEREQVTRH
ncbi:MAG: PIN domain-containing protein [Acidobacteriota bacterium]|nr:PIN domain-containing protein [Acidobacteriota bacterium]